MNPKRSDEPEKEFVRREVATAAIDALEEVRQELDRLLDTLLERSTSVIINEVLELAMQRGLVHREPYDPEKHGELPSDLWQEPGDPIWVRSNSSTKTSS